MPIFRKHRGLLISPASQCDHGCFFIDWHEIGVIAHRAKVVGDPHQVLIAQLLVWEGEHVMFKPRFANFVNGTGALGLRKSTPVTTAPQACPLGATLIILLSSSVLLVSL